MSDRKENQKQLNEWMERNKERKKEMKKITYNSHSSRHSTFCVALSLIDVANFSFPSAIVVKQLLVPFLPFVKIPLAVKTKKNLRERKKTLNSNAFTCGIEKCAKSSITRLMNCIFFLH